MSFAARGTERVAEEELSSLMVRYQHGEADAVEKLVHNLSPVLWRYLAYSNPSRIDTEDLLQDCWLRIHRSRHTYRPSEPVLPWIFAIARHTRLDSYRRRRRQASRETLMSAPPEVAVAPDEFGADRLGSLLSPLPESQQEVIVMLKVTGMSLEEAARATSSTVGAIKQKLHRAYAKLRETIQREKEGLRNK